MTDNGAERPTPEQVREAALRLHNKMARYYMDDDDFDDLDTLTQAAEARALRDTPPEVLEAWERVHEHFMRFRAGGFADAYATLDRYLRGEKP